MKTILIIVTHPARAAEALRAAVGLTLRGDRVVVSPRCPWPDDPQVVRALALLRELGHTVDASATSGDAVEVWT